MAPSMRGNDNDNAGETSSSSPKESLISEQRGPLHMVRDPWIEGEENGYLGADLITLPYPSKTTPKHDNFSSADSGNLVESSRINSFGASDDHMKDGVFVITISDQRKLLRGGRGSSDIEPIQHVPSSSIVSHVHHIPAAGPLPSPANSQPHRILNNRPIRVIGTSSGLLAALSSILGIFILERLILARLIYKSRDNATLKLAQPSVLNAFQLTGAVAIGSCLLLMPSSDTQCLLRDPFLYTSLTCMGSILAARIWRITVLLTPALQIKGNNKRNRSSSSNDLIPCQSQLKTQLQQLKGPVMTALTNMSDWQHQLFVLKRLVCCPIFKCTGAKSETYHSRLSRHTSSRRRVMSRRRSNSTIRQNIPMHRLAYLVFLCMIPQLILQICNLAVGSMRARQSFVTFREDVIPTLAREACECDVGSWPTIVGGVFTAVPFFLVMLLSAWTEDLPTVFNEARAIRTSAKILCVVLVVALPSLAMAESPDAITFLQTCCVLGVTLPPCWFICWSKMWDILKKQKNMTSTKRITSLLRTPINIVRRNSSSFHASNGRNGDDGSDSEADDSPSGRKTNLQRAREGHGKAAALALSIGKMYEEMGMAQKSVDLFDDALDLWKFDPVREGKELIGGFTVDEVNALSASELEYVIELNIAKGRVLGTFNSNSKVHQKGAARAWLDALDIYERCPSRISLSDKTITFPIFSGLFVFLKGDKIEQDKSCTFEQKLVKKFIRETKAYGDPVHFSRALAMECEVFSKVGKYEEALRTFDELTNVYIPVEHSDAIARAYGTDRSSHAFAQKALWLMELGREDECIKACEYVINELVPIVDPKNILGMCELLLPIIRVLKWRGQPSRMKKLFQVHVVDNFYRYFGKDGVTPCRPVFKPMIYLLSSCDGTMPRKQKEEAVEWIIHGEGGGENNSSEGSREGATVPDFLDSVYTKLCWSINSMLSELCMRLSMDVCGEVDKRLLIGRGLRYAKIADRKMKDEEGDVILPIPYAVHEPILSGLSKLAELHGIEEEEMTSNGAAESVFQAPMIDTSSKGISGSNKEENSSPSQSMLNVSEFVSEEAPRRRPTHVRFSSKSLNVSEVSNDDLLGSEDLANSEKNSEIEIASRGEPITSSGNYEEKNSKRRDLLEMMSIHDSNEELNRSTFTRRSSTEMDSRKKRRSTGLSMSLHSSRPTSLSSVASGKVEGWSRRSSTRRLSTGSVDLDTQL